MYLHPHSLLHTSAPGGSFITPQLPIVALSSLQTLVLSVFITNHSGMDKAVIYNKVLLKKAFYAGVLFMGVFLFFFSLLLLVPSEYERPLPDISTDSSSVLGLRTLNIIEGYDDARLFD